MQNDFDHETNHPRGALRKPKSQEMSTVQAADSARFLRPRDFGGHLGEYAKRLCSAVDFPVSVSLGQHRQGMQPQTATNVSSWNSICNTSIRT